MNHTRITLKICFRYLGLYFCKKKNKKHSRQNCSISSLLNRPARGGALSNGSVLQNPLRTFPVQQMPPLPPPSWRTHTRFQLVYIFA